jgi:hypothetical protein
LPQVLAEAGPEGLAIGEIVRRIQAGGLRDLRTSRNPDASVSGALARDVIFWKVAPARFALHAVVAYHRFAWKVSYICCLVYLLPLTRNSMRKRIFASCQRLFPTNACAP